MRQRYPRDRRIDLLKADESRRYAANPERLREEVEAEGPGPVGRIVIDEVQKVPALLDEAHWLLENRGLRFALCGSSARKVRRGAANPLGGRAVRYELHGLTADELADGFDLSRMLDHGYLPRMYQALRPARLLDACIADYLKEEVAAEGLVRNLPDFSDFLHAAALSDGEIINFSNVANDCAVSSHTAKAYFEILEDTRLGRWLPAYRKRRKRRLIQAPKFHLADVGVVNRLGPKGDVGSRLRPLRKGVRELGVPRALGALRLPGARRRAVLLAARRRHAGRLRARRHAARGRGQSERADLREPPEGIARVGGRPPRRRPAGRCLPRSAGEAHG